MDDYSDGRFTWNTEKAIVNEKKHGVSFEEASKVFDDPNHHLDFDEEHSDDEDRFIIIGYSKKPRLLIVCHCYRDDGDAIRIFSARKADIHERKRYERRRLGLE